MEKRERMGTGPRLGDGRGGSQTRKRWRSHGCDGTLCCFEEGKSRGRKLRPVVVLTRPCRDVHEILKMAPRPGIKAVAPEKWPFAIGCIKYRVRRVRSYAGGRDHSVSSQKAPNGFVGSHLGSLQGMVERCGSNESSNQRSCSRLWMSRKS
jgi:hypothetical protein